ncbi:CoA ester lyase [Streptomyces sp. SL13]|uniref:CoA ester lyase n=1 Tax=Streptantibioticus silvisoli TaxID=2705255 RepID=A0AA90H041_9ACTN|nr:CoA ester lyase [Streptantibioticus silvisoli]MDI5968434.1 CoA ester lyase [Streptantibioticus silvisoli]
MSTPQPPAGTTPAAGTPADGPHTGTTPAAAPAASPAGPAASPAGAPALRPRRSVLYMPGANERALDKARTLPADALILDLEDAVAPDAKAAARDRVAAAAASGAYGHREVTIRVNGPGTAWHDDDLRAVAAAGPAAVVVPKVDSARTVRQVERALEAAGAPDHTAIWAMLETPRALLDAREVAAASERLTVLVMGTNDLAKELHAEHVPGRAPLLTGLSLALLAARERGLVILDGVHNDVRDLDAFEAECRQGRQLGFDGKTLIHPAQLEPCNRIFAPSQQEVDRARELIAAFEAAVREGRGVATVGGRMVENLHVEEARRVLALAEAVARPE